MSTETLTEEMLCEGRLLYTRKSDDGGKTWSQWKLTKIDGVDAWAKSMENKGPQDGYHTLTTKPRQ